MKPLVFATTNPGKLKEASAILNLPIEGIGLDIPETQSLDHQQVAIDKAINYFQKINRPLFVEDGSLDFTSLNTLPGTFIDHFSKSLGNEGLIRLLKGRKDRSATARTTLCYISATQEPICFVGEIKGTIARSPRGTDGFGWDPIFIPKGHNKTFAQMTLDQKNSISMRLLALEKLKNFLAKNP